MKVAEHPSLLERNTFGVSASAGLLIEVESEEDVLALPGFDPTRDFVLGGGSNVLFVEDIPGTAFLNRIRGIEVIDEDEERALVEAGAGENWHELVSWCLRRQLYGLENLALIPGLVGAAPIQNIGAYGVELASVLDAVTAWDWHSAAWAVLSKEQCGFGYRDSVFKAHCNGRYLITSIRLRLAKRFRAQLNYSGLQEELDGAGISHPAAADVFAAVIRLRQKKLPDPAATGNAGSFFKNPVISLDQLESLHLRFPNLPVWDMGQNEAKISAAWMIEQCGLKGYQRDGAAVSAQHALVLLNQNNASGLAIWRLARHVQEEIQLRFGIRLEPEPRIYLGSEQAG
jgi:UDP-N-acetylmuramate dehydrogenase